MREVRFGSLADIGGRIRDVRFTPKNGHVERGGLVRLNQWRELVDSSFR